MLSASDLDDLIEEDELEVEEKDRFRAARNGDHLMTQGEIIVIRDLALLVFLSRKLLVIRTAFFCSECCRTVPTCTYRK